MTEENPALSHRIEIPGDVLVLDEEWCSLAGDITRRTSQRLDKEGCPYIYVGGRKYRPLNEGRAWLAGRIKRRNQQKPSRRNAVA